MLFGIPFFSSSSINLLFVYLSLSLSVCSSYRQKARELSELSKTQMMSPLEAGCWWVEYVLKSGGKVNHLKPEWFHLSWYQYFGLDVMLTVLSFPLMGLYGLYKFILILRENFFKEKIKRQ